MDDDGLLSEILLRLPPQPSSLPRASFVCKRWRRLVSDPAFLRSFHARHRKPPILGYFAVSQRSVTFTPTLDPPDRIPAERFSLRIDNRRLRGPWEIMSCRHGRVLLLNRELLQLVVWDPVTGDQCALAVPLEIGNKPVLYGSVLCAAADEGHVHGGCHSSPFKVVLARLDLLLERVHVTVYSSENTEWSGVISIAVPSTGIVGTHCSNILIDSSLYWLFIHGGVQVYILQFDLNTQTLAVLDVPGEVCVNSNDRSLFVPPEGGGLGLLAMSEFTGQMWYRKADCHDVVRWVPGKTIELDKLLSLRHGIETHTRMAGYSQDHNVMFMQTGYVEDHNPTFMQTAVATFIIQLESMQFKKISEPFCCNSYHPFTSFYLPGI